MSSIQTIAGNGVAIRIDNLDTDQVMPKQFLRGIDKQGLAQGLFHDLRYDSLGNIKPDFALNQAKYKQASLLLGGSNFGCGSSREHAVWGLAQ
jgi:3-isopropylmalate/(R)-2-methylmalate dehydratase small subunit